MMYEVECSCCGKILGEIEVTVEEAPVSYNYSNDTIRYREFLAAEDNPDLPEECPECEEPVDIEKSRKCALSHFSVDSRY